MSKEKVVIDWRRYVGPIEWYDTQGALQFFHLFTLGMRHYHSLLDFGCGSLRFGRFAIQYLDRGNYYGIEPKRDLVTEGIKHNCLTELVREKTPYLEISDACDMFIFKRNFDYIMAQSVFAHMPKQQIDKSLESAYKAMKPETIFLATYSEGKVDYGGKEWNQSGAFYRPVTMRAIIEKHNLTMRILPVYHPGRQTWILIRRK